MYTAYSEGIYKSVDKGHTWAQTAFPTYSHFLAIHPLNPEVVYAAVQSSGNEPRGVYKTTNGGNSWIRINNGLDSLQGYDWYVGDIVVDPQTPEDVYLGVSSLQTRFLYRSTNGGSFWFSFSHGFPDSGGVRAIEIDTLGHRFYTAVARWAESGIYLFDWPTNVEVENTKLIEEFQLDQNYPNPFNPTTTVKYYLPKRAFVTLTVHDLPGREIATLVDEYQSIGKHAATFDAGRLPSGVYFYRLQVGNNLRAGKMLLLR